jgi:hypothetical protein
VLSVGGTSGFHQNQGPCLADINASIGRVNLTVSQGLACFKTELDPIEEFIPSSSLLRWKLLLVKSNGQARKSTWKEEAGEQAEGEILIILSICGASHL